MKEEKIILLDDKKEILNVTFSYPLYQTINNYTKQGINVLHFKLYSVPVTYIQEEIMFYKMPPYRYMDLIIDPNARLWSTYPVEMKVEAKYQIVCQDTIYCIESIKEEDNKQIDVILNNIISSNDEEHQFVKQFFHFTENIESGGLNTKIKVNALQILNNKYKPLGSISIVPDIALEKINYDQIYETFVVLQKRLPHLIKVNEKCIIYPEGVETVESGIVLDKYYLHYYNLPYSLPTFSYVLFPVLSIYSNILIYELNKISVTQLPFISICPVPDDKFIEEYEAEKQIIQLKDNF